MCTIKDTRVRGSVELSSLVNVKQISRNGGNGH